jgi:membrane associated rhomboid family serine protease
MNEHAIASRYSAVMLFPIGDTPNPRGFVPWVTWLLIALNVLVHLGLALPASFQPADPTDPAVREILERLPRGVQVLQLSQWDVFVERHGFTPGAPALTDLLLSLFLHANLAHLFGNMLFLWIYGDNVEAWLGRPLYLLGYLGTGIVATLSFAAFATDPSTPLIGASGAISGVLGAYFVAFPRNKVRMLVGLPPFFFNVWLVPAPIVLGLYVALDNLLPVLLSSESSVAYGAHLGGFAGGVVLALVMRALLGRQADTTVADLAREPGEEWASQYLRQGAWLAARGQRAAAYQYLTRALEGSADPEVRARARALLRELELDPRLAERWRL